MKSLIRALVLGTFAAAVFFPDEGKASAKKQLAT